MGITATPPTKTDERQTGLSLLLGMTVWFLHENTAYALASLSCQLGWLSFQIGGLSGLQFVEIVITLIAMLLLLITIYLPWRAWRRFQSEKPTDNPHLLQDTEKDRRPLIAFVTMLLNSLFCIFVIATFLPVFALNACRHG